MRGVMGGYPLMTGTSEHEKANAAVFANDPLRTFAKQSPAVVLGLAFAAGLVLSHPTVQRLLGPPEPTRRRGG
jgi:hypothetical protein